MYGLRESFPREIGKRACYVEIKISVGIYLENFV